MAMEMKLNIKMAQKLVMTPMLQQAIKLLPLARLELASLVRQEMIENPVLEEILEDEQDIKQENENDDSSTEKDETLDKSLDEPIADNSENPVEQETDWDNYLQDNIDRGVSADSLIERPSIEATYNKEPSLSDHLFWQLNLALNTDKEKYIGSFIIGNIQNDGYFTGDISEISQSCQTNEEEVLRVLKIIQSFEPIGVGARNLKECLLAQAKAFSEPDSLVELLIENYLEKLEDRYIPKISSQLKLSLEEVVNAVKKIKGLNPKPGLLFNSESFDYVIPDLVVIRTEEGYDVLLNDEGIPKLRISSYYHDLLKSTCENQTKEYLESKYRSALWLIKSIDQRRQTIYKVGKSIVKLQREFLEKGLSYLKPMVLKDVAQDIEMHESTVSRITTNKYIDTPQGIFELKFFFHSGVKSFVGNNNLSSIRVKNMIKEIVSEENPQKPLTDDEMVEVLMKRNAKIARRTVTKYRKELNIPPTNKRKKFY